MEYIRANTSEIETKSTATDKKVAEIQAEGEAKQSAIKDNYYKAAAAAQTVIDQATAQPSTA